MIALCDTSVLVAATRISHRYHSPSASFILRIRDGLFRGAVATHTLAEYYSVMTAIQDDEASDPESILQVLQKNMKEHFDLVFLDAEDYWAALKRVADKKFRSGAIFDALIFQAALKEKIPVIVTWNKKHFERLSSGEVRVESPDTLL